MSPELLNIGCGRRIHPAFVNVDFAATAPGVIAHDLRRGLPFADGRFDVVYHSHVIEHFPLEGARALLRECRRVLKPGGTVRVVCPDLESIAREYLKALEDLRAGAPGAAERLHWIKLEMYDQTVRERSGGEMAEWLCSCSLAALDYALERIGTEGRLILEAAARREAMMSSRAGPGSFLRRAVRALPRLPGMAREAALRAVLGRTDYEALRLGRFRRSGELHLWMHDEPSMAKLMAEAGFEGARRVGAAESSWPGWPDFGLDTEPDGSVYKPDSLFMEARRGV